MSAPTAGTTTRNGTSATSLASPFPPIADYGFLSDCHTGALVSSDGSIEWMCLPHFDSPSVFGAMLDRGAGSWRVGPYGLYVPAGRRYIPGTNIIETTWMTPQGWLRVVDALTIGPWHDNKHGSSHTRPPTDYDADHLLVRMIECIQGQVQVEIVCEPMLDYGAEPARWSVVMTGEDGVCSMDATDDVTAFRLFSDIRMGIEGNRAHGRHTMAEGEKRFCALSWTEGLGGPHTVEQAEGHLERTAHFWRTWLAEGSYPDHPWRFHLQRSALVLKGLTFMPTGALVAAPTTSLPETPRGERNWDYRYCWMRDAFVHALGPACPGPELGGRRLRPVPGRHGAKRGRLAADHVWDQGPERPRREHPGAPQGLRGRPARADRQRRLQPTPERRLRGRHGLRLPALQEARPHPRAAVAGAQRPGRVRRQGLVRARPGDLGGPRGAPSLRLLEADVLGRHGPRRAAGRTARQRGPGRDLAGAGGRDQARTSWRRGSTSGESSASTTTPTRSTPRPCWSR